MGSTFKAEQADLKKITMEFIETAARDHMPGLSVDTVIFGFHNDKLKVLLSQLGNPPLYGLPGGFVK